MSFSDSTAAPTGVPRVALLSLVRDEALGKRQLGVGPHHRALEALGLVSITDECPYTWAWFVEVTDAGRTVASRLAA